jgi:4-oxalocrotonate tautomerase family enzyme
MPSIRLTVPAGDLTDEQKSALVEQITDTVGDFYLEVKDEEVHQFVNVRIVETAENGYAVGGEIIG